MARYTIDCGSSSPFTSGREVEQVTGGDTVKVYENGEEIRRILVVPRDLDNIPIRFGETTDDDNRPVSALFIFDTSGNRVIGAVHYPNDPGPGPGSVGVWGGDSGGVTHD